MRAYKRILVLSYNIYAQKMHPIRFSISVAPELQNQFKPSGRLFLFLSENPKIDR